MKNHKKIFLIVLFGLLLLSSCYPDVNAFGMIGNKLKKFDSDMISHFSRRYLYNFRSSSYSFPDTAMELNMGVWLRVKYFIPDRINIDSLVNIYSYSAIKECYHNDSCNLLLPRRHFIDDTIDKPEVLPCSNSEDIIPVPLFYHELCDLYSPDSIYVPLPDSTYLPKSYTLFILDAKPGKYIHANLLMEEGIMPEEWEHGYSKGVAVNKEKREAIYWIEIW